MEPNVPSTLVDRAGPGPSVMAANTICGNKVRNRGDDDLGVVEHIMLDVPSGHIAYAVLSFGGAMGMGGKLFAIPWGALVLDTKNKCFVLDTSKDRLEKAPGFDKNHWPSMGEEVWARGIHSYYGYEPYWE